MHFNVLIKTKCPETFRSLSPSDSDPLWGPSEHLLLDIACGIRTCPLRMAMKGHRRAVKTGGGALWVAGQELPNTEGTK